MGATEILTLLGALLGVAGFVFLVRRASAKTLKDGKKTSRIDSAADGEVTSKYRKTESEDIPRATTEDAVTEPISSKAEIDETPSEDIATEPFSPAEVGEEPSAAQPEPEPEEEPEEKPTPEETVESTEDAYKRGLAKTKGGFVSKLSRLFGRKKLDEDLLDDLEEVLFTADIGPSTAEKLIEAVKGDLKKAELSSSDKVWETLEEKSREFLLTDSEALTFSGPRPFVLLMIGVNGVGKTTTIGKLAAQLKREGKSVLLAAGDTFRAAAVEQLEVWGERADVEVVRGQPKSDPSSVIFDAIKKGTEAQVDVVIADTAGRLQNKVDLMDELKKVARVCNKAMEGAPHETWLVLDATTGQNAIQQARIFKEAVDISGIVLTKLDGTAKGGVILGICDQLGVPVRFVGVGEQVNDLREFDPDLFISELFAREDEITSATPT